MYGRRIGTGTALVAALLLCATSVQAQAGESRYGIWQMVSDAPPPSKNIMTYSEHEGTGMAIKVEATNARGQDSAWGYETMFDGEFRPVWGQNGDATTAVEVIDERSTRILNARNGRVYQVIINTLSEDGETISNEYIRLDEDGKPTSVGHATYRRIG